MQVVGGATDRDGYGSMFADRSSDIGVKALPPGIRNPWLAMFRSEDDVAGQVKVSGGHAKRLTACA
jgi:hypothetical protein